MKLKAAFQPQEVSVEIKPNTLKTTTGTPVARDYVERDPYTGDYEITPTAEVQTLQTKNLRMTDNIKINAIPSNYGLITWNGSVLTVS